MTPMQRAELMDDLTRIFKGLDAKVEIEFRQTYAKWIDAALSVTAEKAISTFSSFLNQVYREIKKKEKREQAAESKRVTEARAREMARAVNTATRKQGK